ncbi:hypothetical protein GCK72_005726 [Caenorhabditis remanei]|uniref:Uncharacterized protein n=1 Tax=Caenorhabditis remanei TaxID=31234 RepID=A0A6A5HHC3_CAERE|nr:hypothetical protein GCK72_005726 [Caenorhabditis remanei]KAF1765773.1 hypothetical protein GCK72_005726 [Caenorhabditis remanei]
MANEEISKDLVKEAETSGEQFFNIMEKMDWSQINLPVPEHSIISKNVQCLAPSSYECSNILGKLKAPKMEEQSADLKIRQAQQSKVVLDVTAAMKNTINSTETFSKIPEQEKATFTNFVGIISTQDLSTMGTSSVSQTVQVNYSEAQEQLEASRKLVAKNLTILKSEIRESSEEVVQGFWNTASEQEKVGAIVCEKLKSIHHSLQTHAIRTVTESLSHDIRKEHQSLVGHHYVKLSPREVVQAAFGISSESVDQLLSLIENIDWSEINLAESVHSNISANVRALASTSAQSSGILEKLIAPKTEDASVNKEFRHLNTAKCVLNVISSFNSSVTSDSSLHRISEEEQAIFSNIIGVMASNNLTTSSESTSSSFGFNNVFELSEARRVLKQTNQQSLTEKIRESSEELFHGIWNTANEQEKVAIVVKERLETVHQSMKTLAIQMATLSVNRELAGNEENLASFRSVVLPTREVVQAAFGISNENVQQVLEVLAKVEWSNILLPEKEHRILTKNIKALAEPNFNCDSILGQLNTPEQESESADMLLNQKRKASIVVHVKSAVESAISSDSVFVKLPSEEKAVITNMAGLVVSNDLTSLCSSSETFGFQQRITRNQNANILLCSKNSQSLLQRLREPIENQIQGFWNTASSQGKSSLVVKQKLDTMYETLKTIASQMISETVNQNIKASEPDAESIKVIDKAAREIVTAEFGVRSESVQTALEVLSKIEWNAISLPEKIHQTISRNVRVLAEPTFNCDSILGTLNPPESQEASTEKSFADSRIIEVVSRINSAVESVISNDSELRKLPAEEKAVITKIARLVVSNDLTSMTSTSNSFGYKQTVSAPQSTEILLGTPESMYLQQHLREPVEERIQGFWSTSSPQEKTSFVVKQKLHFKYDAMKMLAMQIASESVETELKGAENNVELMKNLGSSTKEIISSAFGITSETVQNALETLSKIEWTDISLQEKEQQTVSQNIRVLAEPNFDCDSILGKLSAPEPQSGTTEKKFVEQRNIYLVSNVKSAVQSVISRDATLQKLPENEKSAIIKVSEIIVSSDLTSMSSSSSDFKLLQQSSEQGNVDFLLKSPNSQTLIEHLREPIENQIQGFWNTASSQEKLSLVVKQKLDTMYETLKTIASQMISETVNQNIKASEPDAESIKVIDKAAREIVTAEFGVRSESVQTVLEVLRKIEWNEISLPEKIHQTISRNVRVLAEPTFNCDSILGILNPPESQEASTEKSFADSRIIEVVSRINSAVESVISNDSELRKLPAEEKAVITKIARLVVPNDLTSMTSTLSSFGLKQNSSDLQNTEILLGTPESMYLQQHLREPVEERIQGFWSTSSPQEKTSFVVKQKLHSKYDAMKMLAMQVASESVETELKGAENNVELMKNFGSSTKEIISSAFGITSETVQNALETLSKIEWTDISLQEKEQQTVSQNIRVLAEPNFDCDSILGKLSAPEPQSGTTEKKFVEQRNIYLVSNVKSAVQSVISRDATLQKLPENEKSAIIKVSEIIVSNDLTSMSSSSSDFKLHHQSSEQGNVDFLLKSPNSQTMIERLREPIEKQVQGFWSSASSTEKQEMFMKEKIETIHAMLKTFSASLVSETVHRDFMATAQSLAALHSIRLTPREILCSAFGISNEQMNETFRALNEVHWSEIEIPSSEREHLLANLRIVNADVPNVFGNLIGRPEENQEISTVLSEKQHVSFLLNLQKTLEQSIDNSSTFSRKNEHSGAQISNVISLITSENLGDLISQAVQLAQPNMSEETMKEFEIPQRILLDRVVPETTEESIQSFWNTSQLSEATISTIAQKLSTLTSEFVVSAAKQVSTSLTLDYRRKIFNQNSEVIFGDVTRDVVKAAFSVSDETLNQLFFYLEQSDWSQIKLTSRQKAILSANVKYVATSNLSTLLGHLVSKPEEIEHSEVSMAEKQRVEIENTFKISSILLESSLLSENSEEEKATLSNLVKLLTSVDLKTAIQKAAFDKKPDSLEANTSITPVMKIQEHVRQPEEHVVQGFWSNDRPQQETVDFVIRKIEVLKSILNCYSVAECRGTMNISEVVKDAFAVSDQTYYKILKVLGSMQSAEIPDTVKETLSKNLQILNLPPVESLINSVQQESSVGKTIRNQQLAQFLFNFKSSVDYEIGITANLSQSSEKEKIVLNNLVAILSSVNLSNIVRENVPLPTSEESVLDFSIQLPETNRSITTTQDYVNVLRHYLQTFAIQRTSTEVNRVIEIIKTSQSFHLVHTTVLEEIKTIQLRMEVLKKVLLNQATAEEILQEAFQSSEQQMEVFQRIIENVHWEETQLTEDIIRNLRINFSAIPNFEGSLGCLTAPEEQQHSVDTNVSSVRRADAVINLMAAADNAISTSSCLSMMESDERLLHKTMLKTMAVCDLTAPAASSEIETMTQGFYRKVEEFNTEKQVSEKLMSNAEMEAFETSEEAVHGLWSSRKEKETSQMILQARELEKATLATLASVEEENSIYTELASFGSKEQIEKLVSIELRDIIENSFGISEQSLDKLLEIVPKMDWSSLTMPITQKDLVVRNLTLLVPAEANTMESVGTIQAPPEEEAFAELDLKQAREAKVMMDIQECVFTTCVGYTEMNKPNDSEVTSFSALLGTMSICDLVTMAASNIQVDSKYDYYRRPAPKAAEVTITGCNADAFSLALQETGEVTSSGIWSTVSTSEAAKTTVSDKIISVSKTQMSTRASSEQVISHDHELKKDSAETIEKKIPDSLQETLQQNYSIDRSDSNVQIQGATASESFEVKYPESRDDTVSQTMRSQSQKDLQFGGTFGDLQPPLPQEEDTEMTIRQSRLYRSSSQVRAPSEESIHRTEALRRSESLESNARKTFVEKRRDSISMSQKASVERETSMEARVLRPEVSVPVESLQKTKPKELTSTSIAESKDLNVCGSWTTAKPPIGAKVSLQTKKVQKEVTSATMTVASASVNCEDHWFVLRALKKWKENLEWKWHRQKRSWRRENRLSRGLRAYHRVWKLKRQQNLEMMK